MGRTAKGAASRRGSESSSGSDSSLDFLGRPPSHDPSESGSSGSTDFLGRPVSRDPSESANGSKSDGNQSRRDRKQTRPRRRSRVYDEMVRLQDTTNLLIPRRPFQMLVREVLQKFMPDGRMQSSSLEAIQEATEEFIIQLLEDGYLLALHRSRVTLLPKDIDTVLLIDRARSMFRPR
ncbi:uncharacterized protein LOC129578301 [Sitodiplosis mosellana]|uniref:uncharacterized protein LOC129578301 n=1 Tax=Sitodiplosis mosellana TaxID=263140 RepID=UPI0024447FB2|nr:uncharacterized protein LOC129578301 [Sitodiplosis mosellana]XP_055322605.1 uncharacterized protein LOC129578301 [Sitodiplosis mosellana]XP_055322606.1 uncharacterized protein LOC129578301 [Sitodiplosis mosellana]